MKRKSSKPITLLQTRLPEEIARFIRESTLNYGKVKLVLQRNRFFVESAFPSILRKLLQDEVISRARLSRVSSTRMTSCPLFAATLVSAFAMILQLS